jgi:hypothetical protein
VDHRRDVRRERRELGRRRLDADDLEPEVGAVGELLEVLARPAARSGQPLLVLADQRARVAQEPAGREEVEADGVADLQPELL